MGGVSVPRNSAPLELSKVTARDRLEGWTRGASVFLNSAGIHDLDKRPAAETREAELDRRDVDDIGAAERRVRRQALEIDRHDRGLRHGRQHPGPEDDGAGLAPASSDEGCFTHRRHGEFSPFKARFAVLRGAAGRRLDYGAGCVMQSQRVDRRTAWTAPATPGRSRGTSVASATGATDGA